MQVETLFEIARKTFESCLDTLKKKNHDYSKGEDALRNFKLCEHLNLADAKVGIMIRLSDKLARISNLLNSVAQVKDESIEDTIDDSINYLILLKAIIKEKSKKT